MIPFNDRPCSIEKIDQRLGRWQGFLNLFKLCVAKAGNVTDELNEPVFQHFLTSLVPSLMDIGPQLMAAKADGFQARACGRPFCRRFVSRLCPA